MNNGLILGLLFLASCLYSVMLEYGERQWRLVSRKTWLTVAVGVVMVLGALALLIDWSAWLLVCLAFAVAGLPVVGRSLLNEILREVSLEQKINDSP